MWGTGLFLPCFRPVRFCEVFLRRGRCGRLCLSDVGGVYRLLGRMPCRAESCSQGGGTTFPRRGNDVPKAWESCSQGLGMLFLASGSRATCVRMTAARHRRHGRGLGRGREGLRIAWNEKEEACRACGMSPLVSRRVWRRVIALRRTSDPRLAVVWVLGGRCLVSSGARISSLPPGGTCIRRTTCRS